MKLSEFFSERLKERTKEVYEDLFKYTFIIVGLASTIIFSFILWKDWISGNNCAMESAAPDMIRAMVLPVIFIGVIALAIPIILFVFYLIAAAADTAMAERTLTFILKYIGKPISFVYDKTFGKINLSTDEGSTTYNIVSVLLSIISVACVLLLVVIFVVTCYAAFEGASWLYYNDFCL